MQWNRHATARALKAEQCAQRAEKIKELRCLKVDAKLLSLSGPAWSSAVPLSARGLQDSHRKPTARESVWRPKRGAYEHLEAPPDNLAEDGLPTDDIDNLRSLQPRFSTP